MSHDKHEPHVHSENVSDEQIAQAANEDTAPEKAAEDFQKEIQTLKDTVLRQAAEAENLRKRLEKEKEDSIKYASSKFAKDLLPVLDNFERVQSSSEALMQDANDQLKAFVDGITLCEKELLSVFKKHGITKIEVSEGDSFDHQYHQAMCELEDKDRPAGSVIKVFQSGYMYHGRLLRPAMVSVVKKA